MKTYKFLILLLGVLGLAACDNGLKQDLSDASVSVATTEMVNYEGNVLTVKKGTSVEFLLHGNPNYITFFSGEVGHQYIYRNRSELTKDDIVSCCLNFAVWSGNGGGVESCIDQLDIFYLAEEINSETGEVITPAFPGLSKTNFEADSILVEEQTPWKVLIERAQLPKAPMGSAQKQYTYSFPMEKYIDRKLTLAVVLNLDQVERLEPGKDNTYVQSAFNFQNMHLETVWKNGRTTFTYASAFGFTPLNMKNKTVFKDQKASTMPKDLAYGSVPGNVPGMWNFTDARTGNLSIGATAREGKWKYSWIVSDHLNLLECSEPDKGVWVKEISQDIPSYNYIYEKVGTYTATFLMKNVNYDYTDMKTQEFIINVTE